MASISISSVAKSIAVSKKLTRAFKYDLYLREYDGLVEVLGLVDDPTLSMSEFKGREAMFPKKWVTLDVLKQSEVEAYNG
jgi:hypothetical protein